MANIGYREKYMKLINIAIVGIGNCASSLIQGLNYYYNRNNIEAMGGIAHSDIGGYKIEDIKITAAFDIDKRKVGHCLSNAIFSDPNCTKYLEGDEYHHPMIFITDENDNEIIIEKSPALDGIAEHMKPYFQVDENQKELSKEEIIKVLKNTKTDIIINYLPVGSQQATEFWADIALESKCAFINCIPVFIVSDSEWCNKFKIANLPIIGDDVKSQIGATIVHRALTQMLIDRGAKINSTYQTNFGGNTDFLNMTSQDRLESKKISKTESIKSLLPIKDRDNTYVYAGPNGYIECLKDNKISHMRIDFEIFGNIPCYIDLKLSVEDSPNSAGIVIDAIRIAKIALDRKIGGALIGPSAWLMKHPPINYEDNIAKQMTEEFINK